MVFLEIPGHPKFPRHPALAEDLDPNRAVRMFVSEDGGDMLWISPSGVIVKCPCARPLPSLAVGGTGAPLAADPFEINGRASFGDGALFWSPRYRKYVQVVNYGFAPPFDPFWYRAPELDENGIPVEEEVEHDPAEPSQEDEEPQTRTKYARYGSEYYSCEELPRPGAGGGDDRAEMTPDGALRSESGDGDGPQSVSVVCTWPGARIGRAGQSALSPFMNTEHDSGEAFGFPYLSSSASGERKPPIAALCEIPAFAVGGEGNGLVWAFRLKNGGYVGLSKDHSVYNTGSILGGAILGGSYWIASGLADSFSSATLSRCVPMEGEDGEEPPAEYIREEDFPLTGYGSTNRNPNLVFVRPDGYVFEISTIL